MTSKKNKVVYVINGEARDSEYIVHIRDWIEDHVREYEGVDFESTKLFWNFLPKDQKFSFALKFYA